MTKELENKEGQRTACILDNEKVCAGLLPSYTDPELTPGHMWLCWSHVSDSHIPFRGFYPDLDDFPEEIVCNQQAIIAYLKINSVRGLLEVDIRAKRYQEEVYKEKCYKKCWKISQEQEELLNLRCFVPQGQTHATKGRYSWNESREDWDNCSSWVINTLNYLMNRTDFIFCKRPKRLKEAMGTIWGTNSQIDK